MKRWILFLLLLPPLVLGGFVASVWLRLYDTQAKPPYRVGQALAPMPRSLATFLCRGLGPNEPLCLRGYFRERLKGPLEGDPLTPCQGLKGRPLWACAEVQGLRLYGLSNPFGGCARFAQDPEAYLACARYVGRAAFAEKGFYGPGGARETCAKARGAALAACRTGAAMEAVERYRTKILRAAAEFCAAYDPPCANGVLSALRAVLPREEALKACDLLPPAFFARCVVQLRGEGR